MVGETLKIMLIISNWATQFPEIFLLRLFFKLTFINLLFQKWYCKPGSWSLSFFLIFSPFVVLIISCQISYYHSPYNHLLASSLVHFSLTLPVSFSLKKHKKQKQNKRPKPPAPFGRNLPFHILKDTWEWRPLPSRLISSY